ncbi:hypothetical protein CLAFUW4_12843 [Fulvia fulva]|nr:hypothetical protein CLAFUR4_12847 [Fulvia fulva]WPV21212.1 hypothetical protein CLAFUW4_12843 [Fulvia fulva]
MPPKPSNLTSSFSVNDAANEVAVNPVYTTQQHIDSSPHEQVQCPLANHDGSLCRKRCLGEKRYRSMQEHIRRAHPEYYLPKLPATKESFELMISTPPHERPEIDPNHANHHHGHQHSVSQQQQQQQQQQQHHHHDPSGLSPGFYGEDPGLGSNFGGYGIGTHDGGYYTAQDADATAIYNNNMHRTSDEYRRGSLIPTASAAQALAQLSTYRPDSSHTWADDIGSGQVNFTAPFMFSSPTNTEADLLQAQYGTYHGDIKEEHPYPQLDPSLQDSTAWQSEHVGYPVTTSQDDTGLLQTSMAGSPDRPTSMSALHRSLSRGYSGNRPRKSSLTSARLGQHERKRSKDGKRSSGDKSKFSADRNKRWEDLIDAAASATEEEGSRDLTPIPASPHHSPHVTSRTSIPPMFGLGSQFGPQLNSSFQASPLNRALTPPSADQPGLGLEHFPSVDSSISSHQHHHSTDSGSNFHIMNASSIDSSSPVFNNQANNVGETSHVEVYCAGCRRPAFLVKCNACTNCICALCQNCTAAIIDEQSRGRVAGCPRCQVMDSSFKPFQVDLR